MKTLLSLYKKYKEMIDYLVCGVLTTVVSFLFYLLFTRVLGYEPAIANIAKWVSGVLFAFFVNKLFVFNSPFASFKETFKEFVTFVTGRVLSGVIDEGIVIVGCNILHINDLIVQLISFVFVIVANYIISKFFVFKKKD